MIFGMMSGTRCGHWGLSLRSLLRPIWVLPHPADPLLRLRVALRGPSEELLPLLLLDPLLIRAIDVDVEAALFVLFPLFLGL